MVVWLACHTVWHRCHTPANSFSNFPGASSPGEFRQVRSLGSHTLCVLTSAPGAPAHNLPQLSMANFLRRLLIPLVALLPVASCSVVRADWLCVFLLPTRSLRIDGIWYRMDLIFFHRRRPRPLHPRHAQSHGPHCFCLALTIEDAVRQRGAFQICDARRHELSWTHYRTLLRMEDEAAREWYVKETVAQNWSSRALERQVGRLYYERLLPARTARRWGRRWSAGRTMIWNADRPPGRLAFMFRPAA